tara:strand:+ start:83 stop:421 length:339 start_codon:yes stop_codon:yes gene_type:complete
MAESAPAKSKFWEVAEKVLMWAVPFIIGWGINAHIGLISVQTQVELLDTRVSQEDDRIRTDLGKDIARIEVKLTELKELKRSIDLNTVEVARLNAKLDQNNDLLREISRRTR